LVLDHSSAASGGGIPIVKTLGEGLAGNSIERVYGILNGTCNYILSRMETEGLSFAQCLREAQKLGYAEADPTFDIGGFDAAHKLAILTSLAFGTLIDTGSIAIEGIESISLADIEAAAELGYRIKLLGVAVRTPDGPISFSPEARRAVAQGAFAPARHAQRRSRAQHQQLSEIAVALFGDGAELRLAAGGVLPRHDPEPSGEVARRLEHLRIGGAGDDRRSDDLADARNAGE
jgi:homoserine dehydrogenase